MGWGLELSRYVPLNPVRVEKLGFGKADRQRNRVGAVEAPQAEVVRERMGRLRRYRWSSYRASVGLAKEELWVEVEGTGGKRLAEWTM